jgi:hypothetical protein
MQTNSTGSNNESITFQFGNVTYVVVFSSRTSRFLYKDEAHLGGPYSCVLKTLHNKSIKLAFRRQLSEAMTKLENQIVAKQFAVNSEELQTPVFGNSDL